MHVQQTPMIKGGEFLLHATDAATVFTPADFSDDQRMMAESSRTFVQQEVLPLLDRLDNHEEGLMEGLMKKAGELGLFGISIPSEYGGLEMDFNTALLVTEAEAQAEANRLLALFKVRRDLFRVTIPQSAALVLRSGGTGRVYNTEPAQYVILTYPRFGLSAGRGFIVLS
ncbi:MAG: acyl-CoA dehydrogenase family protein, partial [Hymenobacteraceae bacterium]|nr:acyl-CoA dehydrogenase family protein [Hymenobacteraceae bacterium]